MSPLSYPSFLRCLLVGLAVCGWAGLTACAPREQASATASPPAASSLRHTEDGRTPIGLPVDRAASLPATRLAATSRAHEPAAQAVTAAASLGSPQSFANATMTLTPAQEASGSGADAAVRTFTAPSQVVAQSMPKQALTSEAKPSPIRKSSVVGTAAATPALPTTSTAAAYTAPESEPQARAATASPPGPLLMPLASVEPSAQLAFSPAQLNLLADLNLDFLIGSEAPVIATSDTSQPKTAAQVAAAERAAWLKAQRENDELFRALFGQDAFLAQDLRRSQEENRAKLAAGAAEVAPKSRD